MRHGLSDEQWEFIKDLFPEPKPMGRPPADPRKVFDAILWLNNTGAKWRDLPVELGAWQTVFKYFDRWNGDGTLQRIVDRLTRFAIERGDVDSELWCLDGTILRAHRCAGGGAKKGIPRSRTITL